MWFLRYRALDPARYDFVTSGSPIRSLYATFFPRFFNDKTIAETLGKVASWTNVWRLTDPIATELALPEDAVRDRNAGTAQKTITDIKSIDPPVLDPNFAAVDPYYRRPRTARWHLDYWTDYNLIAAVQETTTDIGSPEQSSEVQS